MANDMMGRGRSCSEDAGKVGLDVEHGISSHAQVRNGRVWHLERAELNSVQLYLGAGGSKV